MSCPLPPELLDHIVDHLHDEPSALRACCIVSRSWVPRARIHLFARVKFRTSIFPIESWMKIFPDPSNSPACYTRTLVIHGGALVIAAGTDAGRWIRAFHDIVNLHINTYGLLGNIQFSLIPFHGLSPTIRSLHLELSFARPSEIFGLMFSFPLLEDFALLIFGYGNEVGEWTAPLTSPRLTGSLDLGSRGYVGGIGRITRPLLELPNGLNFTKVGLTLADETDFGSTTNLVSGCSKTLESLSINDYVPGVFPSVLMPDVMSYRHT